MAAPNLFDAGIDRHGEGVEEEAVDNRAAFHWAVLETNRLVLAEHRTIDFVVITGGFGLQNVEFGPTDSPAKKCSCPKRLPEKEGPTEAVTLSSAVKELAAELEALEIGKVYLVPGADDLCDESPTDLHRWATFVFRLNEELRDRHKERIKNLKSSYPNNDAKIRVPSLLQVVDLTFSLERLSIANEPAVRALFATGLAPSKVPEPPIINGITLLGLDSAYFSAHDNDKIQAASDKESVNEIDFLSARIHPDASYLIFTYAADLKPPDQPITNSVAAKSQQTRKSYTDPSSPWSIHTDARKKWHESILQQSQIIGVFGGHFNSSKREIYSHSLESLKPSPDPTTLAKTWLSPPLSVKDQWTLPPDKTARGILLVTASSDGSIRASAAAGEQVQPAPIWFSTQDQASAVTGDDKLIQARAEEVDGHWDKAAEQYGQALQSPDSRVRSTAAEGYERARTKTRSWWWQVGTYLPPLRWVVQYPWRSALVLPILLGLLALFSIARFLRFLFIGELVKRLLIPRYRGIAVLNPTAEMTTGALTGEFNAQMLAAEQEIRIRLMSEQESWMARHVVLLAPSSASFDTLVSSIPKVKDVDVSGIIKFLVQLARAFRWTVDSGLAVFPPDTLSASPTATSGLATLQAGGELSAYAVLKWAWLSKNSWRRKVLINDHSAIRDLARQLAELILGEAFV
jgi:hypothetical protein